MPKIKKHVPHAAAAPASPFVKVFADFLAIFGPIFKPNVAPSFTLNVAPILGISAALLLTSASIAQAGAFYYELAGGLSRWQDSGALYNGGNPSGYGFGGNADLFVTLGGSGGPVEFQGGLISRYTLGSDAANSYTLLTLYPEIRMQVNFLFIGAGVTPLVLREGGPNGAQSFEGPPGRLAYDAEAGVLWSVVPIFSLGFAVSGEWINSTGGAGPAPVLTSTFLMRFYFGFWNSGGGGSSSSESKGWRYPFGNWNGN